MIYSKAEYYFWQGVEAGEQLHENYSPEDVCPFFKYDNELTRTYQEAYKWGYCLGQCLSKQEFRELTQSYKIENLK